MQVYKRTLLLLILISITSCISQKNIKSEKMNSEFLSKVENTIANDSSFIQDIRKYYVLENCNDLQIEVDEMITPISIQAFPKKTLVKTKYFGSKKNLNIIEFKKFKKKFDSINLFTPYRLKSKVEKIVNSDCRVEVRSSEIMNNIIFTKFIIVDSNVDKRINYVPRSGYYLIEFDDDKKVVQKFYLLKSN